MLALRPTDELKARLVERGFSLAGVCSADPPESLPILDDWLAKGHHGEMSYMAAQRALRADPATLLPGVQSIVAVGINYSQTVERLPGEAKIACYALGRDYHRVIPSRLRPVVSWMQALEPESRNRICVDSAPLMEREFANRAGLGWFGKNTMLINSERGSWFLLGFILTTIVWERDEPAMGGCGTCRACIDACPTGAIVLERDRWQVDARRCISYLTIEKRGEFTPPEAEAIGDWTFGCDVCQEVCPFNQPRPHLPLRAQPTSIPDFSARRWPRLSELAQVSESEFDGMTQGSPLRRTRLEGIRRNAAANLRNAQLRLPRDDS